MELFNIEDLKEEQQKIAEIIGIEAYFQLSKYFGGTSIYIAKAEEIINRRARDEQIRQEFTGSNYAQLATKYGLTEVWIRNIVYEKAKEIKARPIDGQVHLFDLIGEENN